jgi:hypothetical protein
MRHRIKNYLITGILDADRVFKLTGIFAWMAITTATIYIILPALLKILMINGQA